ncbi:hypothetical protein MPSEU_000020700 [Mayamaea pseudoterrestris]|nr:hypothetical protein MPSEU_000020700 [Mayamaea pseudoterrestris]
MALRPLLRTVFSSNCLSIRCLTGKSTAFSNIYYRNAVRYTASTSRQRLPDAEMATHEEQLTIRGALSGSHEQSQTTSPNQDDIMPRFVRWRKWFSQLETFIEQNDGRLPEDFELEQLNNLQDQKLWKWCQRQRVRYCQYVRNVPSQVGQELLLDAVNLDNDNPPVEQHPSAETQERIQLLNSIGFIWNRKEESWARHYDMLREYHRQHLDTLVPVSNPHLGRWVRDQRTHRLLYQKGDRRSPMTPERIKLLEDLDFCWNADEAKWLNKCNDYANWRKLSQRTGALPSVKEDPVLHAWCLTQRQYRRQKREGKHNSLTDDREEKLNALGFPWGRLDRG